jgi:hypothetical protein
MMIFIILSSLLLFGNFHNHFIFEFFIFNFISWQNFPIKKCLMKIQIGTLVGWPYLKAINMKKMNIEKLKIKGDENLE